MAITPRVGEEVTLKLPGTDHRVVIVGSGFGGLFAARFLRGATIEVTLIDRTNHHLFQPLLYQVATGHPVGRSDRAGDPRRAAKPQEHRGRDGRGHRASTWTPSG